MKFIATLQRKWDEYLIEIVVIVIGVLLAFMLNNWNEERKQRLILREIFNVMVTDIKNDTAEIRRLLEFYENREPLFQKIIKGSMTRDDWMSCEECGGLLTSLRSITVDKRGYEQLKDYVNNFESSDDSLIFRTIQVYSSSIRNIDNFEEAVREDVLGNLVEWRDTQEWFADIVANRTYGPAYYDHVLNDPFFRNKVAWHYTIVYNNYLLYLRSYKRNITAVLGEVETKLTE